MNSELAIVKWIDNDGVQHEALMFADYAWKIHLALVRKGIKEVHSWRLHT